jgi:hypothetical protein
MGKVSYVTPCRVHIKTWEVNGRAGRQFSNRASPGFLEIRPDQKRARV